MEWFSYVIAIAIGLSAVISPFVTTIINNNHQLKLKKLDMYEMSKRNALVDFIKSAETYLLDGSYTEQYVEYYSALTKLFIYFSNVSLDLFLDFEKYCKLNQKAEAMVGLTNIVQVLSKQISKE